MYSVNGNCFRISVRNLVEFMCAEGDIDNRNTGSNDVKIMQEGARIHRKIQHSMGTMYHAEVPLKIEIPLVSDLGIEYVLQVEGRADGIPVVNITFCTHEFHKISYRYSKAVSIYRVHTISIQ